MSGGGNQDLAAMKKLLNSWHVGILYELFKEEEIGIDELKMMQLRHINNLLQNYKIGVRIRFEHHFNNWRNTIGLPLKADTCCGCHYKVNTNIGNSFMEYDNNESSTGNINNGINLGVKRKKHNNEDAVTDHMYYDESQPPLSPRSIKSEPCLDKNMMNSNENESNLMPLTVPVETAESPTIQKTNNTDDETEMDNLNISALSNMLSSSVNETPPKFPSKPTHERCPVNLATILQESGQRAHTIVNFYKEKKRLTNIHRTQLIQTIVEYFDENDYHLSLNMSHNLEWEILKMFPTEKLEYYRTEKRGKIYVKFSNMKRYKRERNNKVRSEIETINLRSRHSTRNGNDDNNEMLNDSRNEDFSYCEWPAVSEPEIVVKEERLGNVEAILSE